MIHGILITLLILGTLVVNFYLLLCLRNARASCKCGAYEEERLVPKMNIAQPKFAQRWSDETIVKFSQRYRTLKDNEV